MRVTWLADVLREAGLDVWESPGWRGRGKELSSVEGVVAHHTGSSPRSSDTMVHGMLRDGRPDLAGPLAQLGLERDGTLVVICDGKANHNGFGTWGNSAIGIEAYNDGVGEPWPSVQLDAYDRAAAAILRRLGLGTDRLKAHRETDPRRKPDPVGIDMNAMRARVSGLLTFQHPNHPQSEEDDMAQNNALLVQGPPETKGEIHYVVGNTRIHVDRKESVEGLRFLGVKYVEYDKGWWDLTVDTTTLLADG